jgi:LPS-assembly lipoprotein
MMLRCIPVLLLVALLSACGWHLRGNIVLPDNINSVYIDNRARSTELEDDLITLLKSNGVAVSQSGAADLTIIVLEFKQNRRVNSLNSNTIVREYELTTEAEYEIKNAAGATLLAPDIAQLNRIYTFDQNAVVSAAEEERIIQRELRLELAQQIVRRLRFLE